MRMHLKPPPPPPFYKVSHLICFEKHKHIYPCCSINKNDKTLRFNDHVDQQTLGLRHLSSPEDVVWVHLRTLYYIH